MNKIILDKAILKTITGGVLPPHIVPTLPSSSALPPYIVPTLPK